MVCSVASSELPYEQPHVETVLFVSPAIAFNQWLEIVLVICRIVLIICLMRIWLKFPKRIQGMVFPMLVV